MAPASIPRQVVTCVFLVICVLNAVQTVATVRNWRPREKLIRANSVMVRSSHICFMLIMFFSALSSLLSSFDTVGMVGVFGSLSYSLSAFATQSWMMIVGHETIRSGYHVATHTMPRTVMQLFVGCWISWWIFHPLAFIAGVISDSGKLYAVSQTHNAVVFAVMLSVLAWSSRRLINKVAEHHSQQDKAQVHYAGKDLKKGIRGHIRRVVLMCFTCLAAMVYYCLNILVIFTSNIPYVLRDEHRFNGGLAWEVVTMASYGLQICLSCMFTYLYWVEIDRRGPRKSTAYTGKGSSSPISSTNSSPPHSSSGTQRSSPVPPGILSLTQINNILLPDTESSALREDTLASASSARASDSPRRQIAIAAQFCTSPVQGTMSKKSTPRLIHNVAG